MVPREVLKTAASGLGFQYLPRDQTNINAWKTMFDPCIENEELAWLLGFPLVCVMCNVYDGLFVLPLGVIGS